MTPGFWTTSDALSHARFSGRIRRFSVECKLEERLALLTTVDLYCGPQSPAQYGPMPRWKHYGREQNRTDQGRCRRLHQLATPSSPNRRSGACETHAIGIAPEAKDAGTVHY